MAYLELFKRVEDHLKRLDEPIRFRRGSRLRNNEISRICERSAIPIPASVVDLYAEVGNGFSFSWEARGEHAPFANLEFPPLLELAAPTVYGIEWKNEWSETYDFHGTKNPQLAKETAIRMRKWLHLQDDGSGSTLCLDTALNPAPVLSNQHAWYNGGSGENGHVLGNSLLDFMASWSKVCFQWPRWWPTVFKKGSGVDWASAEFREPFLLTA